MRTFSRPVITTDEAVFPDAACWSGLAHPCRTSAEPGSGRAKVSPKPWDWRLLHDTGCCSPVGERLRVQVLPEESLARRSVVPPRASPSGAVRSRVERGDRPREGAPTGGESWEADGCQGLEGRRPGGVGARAPATTGVCERGRAAAGEGGHVGAPPVSLSPCPAWGTGRPQALARPTVSPNREGSTSINAPG